jgi:hypothetical protein
MSKEYDKFKKDIESWDYGFLINPLIERLEKLERTIADKYAKGYEAGYIAAREQANREFEFLTTPLWTEENIKSPKPKFKVGDRVRVTKGCIHCGSSDSKSYLAEVINPELNSVGAIEVFADGASCNYCVKESDCKLIEPEDSDKCQTFAELLHKDQERKRLREELQPVAMDYCETCANNYSRPCEECEIGKPSNYVDARTNPTEPTPAVHDANGMELQVGDSVLRLYHNKVGMVDLMDNNTNLLWVSGVAHHGFGRLQWNSKDVILYRRKGTV